MNIIYTEQITLNYKGKFKKENYIFYVRLLVKKTFFI